MTPDYYAILQVHTEAEPEVIEAAYRRLAKKYHPDINKDPAANETMRLLNEAFEVLSDPRRREEYDRARRYFEQQGQTNNGTAAAEGRGNTRNTQPSSASTPATTNGYRRVRVGMGVAGGGSGVIAILCIAITFLRLYVPNASNSNVGARTAATFEALVMPTHTIGSPIVANPTATSATGTSYLGYPEPTPYTESGQPKWLVTRQIAQGKIQAVIRDGIQTLVLAEWLPSSRYDISPQFLENGSLAKQPDQEWYQPQVVDLDGDGVKEAVVTVLASSCYSTKIFKSDRKEIRQIEAPELRCSPLKAKNLDGDNIPEFEGTYFAAPPFSAPFPMVFCRSESGAYYDCIVRFPSVLQQAISFFRAAAESLPKADNQITFRRAYAAGLLVCYLRLGLPNDGWSDVRKYYPQDEQWLRENLGDLQRRLSPP